MANTVRETARGFAAAQNTNTSLTNTATNTAMYSQVLKAGSMGVSKEMNFKFICLLTTGAVLAPTLNISVSLGSSSLTVASSLALSLSQSARPFIVEGSIINKDSATAQLAWAKITQFSTTLPILLGSSSSMTAADWTEDTTADKTFTVSAQFGSAIAGTTLTFRHASIDLT